MSESLNIPDHVAIIMDGNGRWAKSRGYDRSYGHMMGVDSVNAVIEQSLDLGVKYLTLYAFSSENWERPQDEVNYLMELFCSTIVEQKDVLKEHGVSVHFMGRIPELNDKVRSYIEMCEQETACNNRLRLIIALNYSSRNELVDAVKRISKLVMSGDLLKDEITVDTISDSLYFPSVPDPDLIIRTSGENRLSNFMLWQASYSEFYFTEILWPDFKKDEYLNAIKSYSKRKRRFGAL